MGCKLGSALGPVLYTLFLTGYTGLVILVGRTVIGRLLIGHMNKFQNIMLYITLEGILKNFEIWWNFYLSIWDQESWAHCSVFVLLDSVVKFLSPWLVQQPGNNSKTYNTSITERSKQCTVLLTNLNIQNHCWLFGRINANAILDIQLLV